jgi:peroxiredoxin
VIGATPTTAPADGSVLPAPPWATTRWFNSDPLDLVDLRGRVVVVEAFQMLCPGCVAHALPQATRLAQTFGDDLVVVGLHSVFEHHDAMTPTSLAAFLHEYRIRFPVAVDAHEGDDPLPVTFGRYAMRGTPTTVLIDRDGNLRGHQFGAVDDMTLAAAVARLLDAGPAGPATAAAQPSACSVDGTCT